MEQDLDNELEPATVSIDIAATPDQVWSALTTPSGLAPWLGEGATIDPCQGGKLSAPDPVGGRPRRGLVDNVDAGRRLELTWWPATNPVERSQVVISLESTGSADEPMTTVTVTESVPEPVARRASASATAEPLATVGAWSWRLALLVLACQLVIGGVARSALV